MSKHNNNRYHNYQNYSNNRTPNTNTASVEEVVEPVIEETVEPVVVEEPVAVTAAEETVEPTVEVEEPVVQTVSVYGVVNGCNLLRVRKAPSTDAAVLCEIDVNSKVEVNEVESTADFYKVCTEAGIEGFCMKKFIKIES